MITKGDIVKGAFQFLKIWGITNNASPEDVVLGLGVLDDYSKQLESDGLGIGYISPPEYGQSDPNDESGLSDWMGGPIKKLLAVEIAVNFGKEMTPTLMKITNDGIRSLENALVNVPCAQNPGTLPKGSGNEWAYNDSKFYNEPSQTLSTSVGGSLDGLVIEKTDGENY